MKIGIISDSHGSMEDFERALMLLKDVGKVLHLGDVLYHGPRNDLPESYNPKEIAAGLSKSDKFIYIKGNCDSEVDEMVIMKDLSQKERIVEIDGYRFYLTHGHNRSREDLLEKAREVKAQAVLTGHTHVKVLERDRGVVFLNPGSISIPKDGSKSLAFYEKGSFSLVDLASGEVIKTLSIVE